MTTITYDPSGRVFGARRDQPDDAGEVGAAAGGGARRSAGRRAAVGQRRRRADGEAAARRRVSSSCRIGCWPNCTSSGAASEVGADQGGGRPAGERGRQRGRAGHRRVVHGRADAARSVLPSVLQRGRAGDAARPAADVLRGQQRRQRCAARIWCGCWKAAAIAGASSSSARAAARWRRRPRFAFCCASCAARWAARRSRSASWSCRSPARAGKLFELAKALGCREMFPVPDGVGGRFSVLSAVGLLPAALLGLDIEKLLSGAAAMNEHFRTAPPDENIVLQYVGVCHLMEERAAATCGCSRRGASGWKRSGCGTTSCWPRAWASRSAGRCR